MFWVNGCYVCRSLCYNCLMSTLISLPNQLYERVRQSAHKKQQTVDEYLTELVLTALNVDEIVPITEDEALAKEAQAWESLYPMLKEKYTGQHVAIYQGRIVDVDADPLLLHRRIRNRYLDKAVWMSRVEEQPFPEIFTTR